MDIICTHMVAILQFSCFSKDKIWKETIDKVMRTIF